MAGAEPFEIVCNKCLASVAADAEVCPSCGATLIERQKPPAAVVAERAAPAEWGEVVTFGRRCDSCQRAPATGVVVRRHVGMLLVQRFVKVRANLCRECGSRILRQYTLRTLWQGWWGLISFFANAFTILANVVYLLKLRRLPSPQLSSTPLDRIVASYSQN